MDYVSACIYPGKDLQCCDLPGPKPLTDTAEDCLLLCHDTTDCFGWTWLSETFPNAARRKECVMKDEFSVPMLKDGTGLSSGPKNCPTGNN